MENLDWTKITPHQLEELRSLDAIFIAGSRTISAKRIIEIAKKYIFKGNIIWGYLEDRYIEGFESQPHFRTLSGENLKKVLDIVEKHKLPYKFTLIKYKQSSLPEILESLNLSRAIFINASWHIAFHRRPEYEILERKNIKPKLISPFINDDEAILYSKSIQPKIDACTSINIDKTYNDSECMQLAYTVSKRSFDYTWQTGAVIAREGKVLITGHNRILPYETYMWHSGSLKEHGIGKSKELSQIHNLNTNDTLHAEMDALITALNSHTDLEGSTLYVSLMPCPNCARAIAATKIKHIVYEKEHFGGLAEAIFKKSGKEVTQMG